MEEIVIRDYIALIDEPFIFDSWLKSYFGQSPATMFVPRKEFNKKHSLLVSRIIRRSTIKIASKAGDGDVIIGYIVYEQPANVIHYLYVKEDFRGFGIGSALLAQSKYNHETRVTHLTMKGKEIARNHELIYSPYF